MLPLSKVFLTSKKYCPATATDVVNNCIGFLEKSQTEQLPAQTSLGRQMHGTGQCGNQFSCLGQAHVSFSKREIHIRRSSVEIDGLFLGEKNMYCLTHTDKMPHGLGNVTHL
jgi:hypothetical protein